MAKRGRPTKFTPETRQKIIHAVSIGATYELASLYAGLNRDTVQEWARKGRNQEKGIYHDFSVALKEAEGKGLVGCLLTIRKAAPKQWQAAAWLLERRYPDVFGRVRLEHTGKDGKPIQTEDKTTPRQKPALSETDQVDLLRRMQKNGALDYLLNGQTSEEKESGKNGNGRKTI